MEFVFEKKYIQGLYLNYEMLFLVLKTVLLFWTDSLLCIYQKRCDMAKIPRFIGYQFIFCWLIFFYKKTFAFLYTHFSRKHVFYTFCNISDNLKNFFLVFRRSLGPPVQRNGALGTVDSIDRTDIILTNKNLIFLNCLKKTFFTVFQNHDVLSEWYTNLKFNLSLEVEHFRIFFP